MRGKLKVGWRILAEDDAADGLHQIKGCTQDRFVITIAEDFWSHGIDAVGPGENTELACHIVRGFHFAAERGATQNEFPASKRNRIGQVGMAAGILLYGERSVFVRKVSAEKSL